MGRDAPGWVSAADRRPRTAPSPRQVREVLLTSALLKLPRSVPLAQKRQLVEDTLRELVGR